MSIFSKLKLTHNGIRKISTTSISASPISITEANRILRSEEFNKEFSSGSVKGFDSNQLPSNSPMEDNRSEAQCSLSKGHLFGIFDGHGGMTCSHVISERLLKYIAASLAPLDYLRTYIKSPNREELITPHKAGRGLIKALHPIYDDSFNHYLRRLCDFKEREELTVERALEYSFLEFDADISNEAIKFKDEALINEITLAVALTGAVACVAHIDGPHLHIANVGDCSAVLGIMNENNSFDYKKMTIEHNYDNENEVNRILNEHPPRERETIFRMDRLLGDLAPLRSLGDYRYKWPKSIIKDMVVPYFGHSAIPQNYHTPPYLSGRPDVHYHYLRPKDKFLVIASDGLWEIMTPMEVINVVGQHMLGKPYFAPFKLSDENMTLGEIQKVLIERRKGILLKPADENAATHLLRHALGGMEHGSIQDERLSFMLSLPADMSRSIRDDISITIIYFDTEHLSNI